MATDWFNALMAGLNSGGQNPGLQSLQNNFVHPQSSRPLINQTNETGNPQYAMWNATGLPYPQSTANQAAAQSPQDFLKMLFNQLLQNSGGYNAPSAADILKQATSQVAGQYDPQIAAIQRQIGSTKSTANKNKGELKSLYNAGADAYNEDIASAKKTGAAAVADEKSRQADLQNKLSSDYSQSLDDQIKQFETLGVQSATPAATERQRNDLDYLSKLNDTMGNANLADLNAENTGDLNYYNEGKGIMRLQGNQAVGDLMSQLQDYLTGANGDINSLQAQKTAAIQSLQNQLTTQAAQAQQQAQQSQWENLYKLMGFYQSMNQQPQNQAHSGLNAASQFLSTATTPQKAKDTMGAIQLLLSSPQIASGRMPNPYDKNSSIPLTPEQAATYGGNYADKNGWSPADKMNLMQALLAYFGRMGG